MTSVTPTPEPLVTLPDDCTPFTPWMPWRDSDGRKCRVVHGRTFGDQFLVTTSAIQFDDGSMSHATLDIKSRHHDRAPGCLDAADACQVATNLLAAANEIDRLNAWIGE